MKDVHPLSEEGICIFDFKNYFPKKLGSQYMDYEWTLFAGFETELLKNEFIRALKSNIGDCWYNEVIRNPIESIPITNFKFPIIGELRVFVTEVRNIDTSKFKEFINASSKRRKISNKVEIKLDYRAPQSFYDIYKSYLVENEEIQMIEKVFHESVASVKGELADNISWSTPEQPAGEMQSMGDLAELPESNAFLRIKVCISYVEEKTQHEFVFGEAE